ncbi:MAG: hypothetical protein L0387_29510 [Acidobacteria bacterium]|nr:hypothetical protein [Acidobacteriota bacterium]MCI0717452.1 hypothetical protein [Acidobacteriota bacterium]
MEIKPPGSGKPNFKPTDETQKISKKTEKTFSVERPHADPLQGASLTEKAQQAHFPGVSAQFSKKDLRNPQTVEVVVRTSVQELIQTEFPKARFASEEDRKNFVELMANDPLFRGKLLGHLEKLLT